MTCEIWRRHQRDRDRRITLLKTVEEALELILAGDEDHLGMSSDEESDLDRELDYESGNSR